MQQYQTEVVIPPDRYVCLQLPDHLPEGRATVVVIVQGPHPAEHASPGDHEPDDQDIEWWDEFEGDRER